MSADVNGLIWGFMERDLAMRPVAGDALVRSLVELIGGFANKPIGWTSQE
jgi:hypothetical protein